jgi:hypothetical protein
MADKVEEQKFTPEVEKALSEATSSDQIRDIVAAQPRDEKTGKFAATTTTAAATTATTTEKKDDPAAQTPTVYKDTFLIGGKEVEFTGDSPADVLKQVKVAQQAYEMGKAPEVKKEAAKPAVSAEELAALRVKAASGDMKAQEEYLEKSGFLDRYLEKKGINPSEVKQILEDRASERVTKDWDGAVKGFLADSDWPGGTQNEKLLKYKLAELKDEKGQPLAYSPSVESLKRAYESLKQEGMLFPGEEKKTETTVASSTTSAAAASATATTTTTTEPVKKRTPTGSTLFGTSREAGSRSASPTKKDNVPAITDDMTPQQIMDSFKQAAIERGESPDDVLRATYAGRT